MKHLFIRVAEYAYDHPEGFTYLDLIGRKIIQGENEEQIMCKHFENATNKSIWDAKSTLDSMFLAIEPDNSNYKKSKCILTFEAYFNYLDYLEFQEARKSSRQAMDSSKTAIRIAWITLFVSIVFSMASIYFSQSTELDRNQFDELKNIISSEIEK